MSPCEPPPLLAAKIREINEFKGKTKDDEGATEQSLPGCPACRLIADSTFAESGLPSWEEMYGDAVPAPRNLCAACRGAQCLNTK